MRYIAIALLFVVATSSAADRDGATRSPRGVTLVAVSREAALLGSGVSSGNPGALGRVAFEPIASLTPSGKWRQIPCHPGNDGGCRRFERKYLSKPHTYFVVSAAGHGATIHADPVALGDCFEYDGQGTYTGASIHLGAVAASSTGLFTTAPTVELLTGRQATQVRKELTRFVPKLIDTTASLRLYSVRLNHLALLVVQRSVDDARGSQKLIFGIFGVIHDRLRLLRWKQDSAGDEAVLGTIRLRSGKDLLITTERDSESQWFRIYSAHDGRLVQIFNGGGQSC